MALGRSLFWDRFLFCQRRTKRSWSRQENTMQRGPVPGWHTWHQAHLLADAVGVPNQPAGPEGLRSSRCPSGHWGAVEGLEMDLPKKEFVGLPGLRQRVLPGGWEGVS